MIERFWTAREAAEYLNVSTWRLYELVRMNAIPHIRLGGRQLRFDPIALREWARAQTSKVIAR